MTWSILIGCMQGNVGSTKFEQHLLLLTSSWLCWAEHIVTENSEVVHTDYKFVGVWVANACIFVDSGGEFCGLCQHL